MKTRKYQTLAELLGSRSKEAQIRAQMGSDKAEGIHLPRYVYASKNPKDDPRSPLDER